MRSNEHKKIAESTERGFHKSRRKVYAKISKPVSWNGIYFESGAALARHLKIMPSAVSNYIKKKNKLKGHVPERITKEVYNERKQREQETHEPF